MKYVVFKWQPRCVWFSLSWDTMCTVLNANVVFATRFACLVTDVNLVRCLQGPNSNFKNALLLQLILFPEVNRCPPDFRLTAFLRRLHFSVGNSAVQRFVLFTRRVECWRSLWEGRRVQGKTSLLKAKLRKSRRFDGGHSRQSPWRLTVLDGVSASVTKDNVSAGELSHRESGSPLRWSAFREGGRETRQWKQQVDGADGLRTFSSEECESGDST